jgi:type I restriction enzyme S subunit
LADLHSGHTPSRRHAEWWGGTVPWLALPDIRRLHGKYAHETAEYTNDLGLANSSAHLLPVGTVCVSRTASIGFVTILGRPMATSQDFCNWVCNKDKLNEDFLLYAFMASRGYLRELGSGAVHKTIYMPTIESFHIYAPDSVEEQKAIAQAVRSRLEVAEEIQRGIREQLADVELLSERVVTSNFVVDL